VTVCFLLAVLARFSVRYFGGSCATFTLSPDGCGGTDVQLADEEIAGHDVMDVAPGWVSELMALKAYADHGIDMRNHDGGRTWAERYCDN